ncbi:hypothetical protein NQ314_015078 [Rhamnusium bicolor]|uniref:ZAD domain-containing protein n=1 Tax=Rhamnusium bicolor TaxID=1586634 RepID=A0AAV8WZ10_9CUCU|nr:hypothetical protein NQ314_015078 [Rhamnusium bicolor]
MYYLSKFCRICVQTDVKLLDLDTLDFDEVKLSEKLEVCTKMVVSRESLSTEICVQCIAKLRISYQFHDIPDEEEDTKENIVKFEEVIVEPDIKIKTEMEFEDEGECMYSFDESYIEVECKKEMEEQDRRIEASANHHCSMLPIPMPSNYSEYMRSFGHIGTSNTSMQLLDNLVGSYQSQRRTFSQSNVRCRTRENPYINPTLKDQFLYRSFKCEKCNRYFKSPGYLKAHYSKVH